VASLTDPRARLAEPRHDPGAGSVPGVRLTNLTRVFGTAPAVVRVDLEVATGETLLVRGPNGAGKSTLLRLIATAISPTYGSGTVLGFDLVRGRDDIRRRTELLGHRTRLYEDLSAAENLRFACAIHGVDASGVDGALARVGLAGAAGDRVRTYSQGMRQRVAVARALVRRPDLLLLDEPYAGLDEASKDVVDEAIAEAAARGATVLLATHDPLRGERADRTVIMESGVLRPSERTR
jgi:heme exporter protein A